MIDLGMLSDTFNDENQEKLLKELQGPPKKSVAFNFKEISEPSQPKVSARSTSVSGILKNKNPQQSQRNLAQIQIQEEVNRSKQESFKASGHLSSQSEEQRRM